MIHILIINLLIKKPFYLLRRQSFSFQIVPEVSIFMSRRWAFDFFILSWGRVFVHNDCPEGGFLPPPLRVVSLGGGRGGVKLIAALLLCEDLLKRDPRVVLQPKYDAPAFS